MKQNNAGKWNFNILRARVVGIKNPVLSIELDGEPSEGDFKVYADDKSVGNISIFPVPVHHKMVIEANIDQAKYAKLVYIIDGEEHELVSKPSVLLFRILDKILSMIKIAFFRIKVLCIVSYRGIRFLWIEHHFLVPVAMWKHYFNKFIGRTKERSVTLYYNPTIQPDYIKWLEENPKPKQLKEVFTYNPCISILIPTYNIKRQLLSECLDSILAQSYPNFEICIADDCSTLKETIKTLQKYEKSDSRIKVIYRNENGHISRATNDALSIATGEFIGLVDNDDVLAPNALYEVVKVLNENPKIDMIYSDEDKIDAQGKRRDPHFKPDFSPDTLLSLNYICHFTVLRTSIVNKIGGLSVGLEGAQDYDLFLRFTEQTNNIYHIPKILYHWRMIPGSTSMDIDNKDYATDKGTIALERTLQRRGIKGKVKRDPMSAYHKVEYELDKEPLISIIIPTKDYADITETCLASIYEKTMYKNYEIILMDNRSEELETIQLFSKYEDSYDNFRVVKADFPFNYSKINNLGIKQANGEIIVLLNNDTEVISPNWLDVMVGYAMQPHIGAVGPKLLYPDLTVQHGGVILGLGGVAGHAHIGDTRDCPGMYGRLRVPYNFGAVTAACLMVRKEVFLDVGGLEEELEVAFNDIDFNMKLLEKGLYNLFVPQIELLHYESKSRGLDTSNEKYKRFLKEANFMTNKWDKYTKKDPFYNDNYSKKMCFYLDKKSHDKIGKDNMGSDV